LKAAIELIKQQKEKAFPNAVEQKPPTVVRGKTFRNQRIIFRNQRIILDGSAILIASFENVTVVYNGTAGGDFLHNNLHGSFYISSDVPAIFGAMDMLNAFGFLKIPLVTDSGIKQPTSPLPTAH
jgi:hypothetical protein